MRTRLGPTALSIHRRAFLGRAAQGVGAVALASLLDPSLLRAQAQPSRRTPPFLALPQKAKRVIWLTMAGGPSQFETFDPKPGLARVDGQPMPESFTRGQQLAQRQVAGGAEHHAIKGVDRDDLWHACGTLTPGVEPGGVYMKLVRPQGWRRRPC